MTSSGVFLAKDEGPATWFLGTLMTTKVAGDQTGGALTVIEQVAPEGFATPFHLHKIDDEAFYVLEGEIEVTCNSDTWRVSPSGFVFLPKALPHGFRVTRGPSRILQITSPSGFEQFMAALGEPAGQKSIPSNPPEPEKAMTLLANWSHYVEILGPPPAP